MKYLILDNIRSAYNVGAIFRTADGAGVTKIFLVGYTPTPIDRFGRPQSEIHKTSLGASTTVPWEHITDVSTLIARIKEEDCTLVVIEQTPQSITFAQLPALPVCAYVLGNEIDGVSAEFLSAANFVVELPMLGEKESLNVSVTAGIVLYHGLV